MRDTSTVSHGVHPTRPSPARLYDYYLGETCLWGAEDPAAADTDGSRGYYCSVAQRPEGGLR